MEFTVQKSAKDSLISLAGWVKKKAEDPVHENNRDLIADFLEKVVVVELKKLTDKDEVRDVKVDIPDDELPKRGPDPAVLINKVMGALASELKDEDGNPLAVRDIAEALANGTIPTPATPAQSEPKWMDEFRGLLKAERKIQAVKLYRTETGCGLKEAIDFYDRLKEQMKNGEVNPAPVSAPASTTPSTNKFSGNNHSCGKKRRLTDQERDFITSVFDKKNGNLDEKDCSDIADHLGLSVNGKTPWQVTGYVSELHRRVADGRHTVPDKSKYVPPAKKTSLAVTQPSAQTASPKFAADPRKVRA